jgi:asparagine synthase (glutamine-hydrolysing)
VPIGAWIAQRGEQLAPLVVAQPGVAALAAPDRVAALFRAGAARGPQAAACWALLFYALWHRRHILGLPPEGGVFETLAAL